MSPYRNSVHALKLVVAFAVASGCSMQAAQAQDQQQFVLSSKAYEVTWSDGSWDGKTAWAGVYCGNFPTPERARRMVEGMFNRNSIHLSRVEYDNQIVAALAVSVLPEGRTPESEIGTLADVYKQAEAATGRDLGVVRTMTDFGPTLRLKLKDLAPDTENGPFPLVTGAFYTNPQKPIQSLSVHRIFVRGPDRIEVALFQMAPQPATDKSEAEMTQKLTTMADQMVASVQSCTARLPLRKR
ncbi:hypothetical protein PQR62_20400 [Herbaspirillum lusitanum]|uniref:DUF3313 domain-containing protein n=1 Tax=Herbaspirillum lusitanum TaxID=213312 RepID=A0ABW9ACP2_9BURK